MKNKNFYSIQNIRKIIKKNELKLSLNDEKRKQFHKALKKEFPILWREPEQSTMEMDEYSRPSCDEGWQSIIWTASQELNDLVEQIKEVFSKEQLPIAAQVKEKFGILRFGFDGSFNIFPVDFTKNFYSVVTDAENESAVTCEICGNPGTLKSIIQSHKHRSMLVKTLCQKCLFEEREISLLKQIHGNITNQIFVNTLIEEHKLLLSTMNTATSNKKTTTNEE
jgi:hypothetical protein